jgi:hypothetical protein
VRSLFTKRITKPDRVLLREYIYIDDDTPIAQISTKYTGTTVTSRRTLFIHADHLTTPRAASDSTQKLVWRWDGNAYGQSAPSQNPDGKTGTGKTGTDLFFLDLQQR